MILGQKTMRILPIAYADSDAFPDQQSMTSAPSSAAPNRGDAWKLQLLLCDDTLVNGLTNRSIDIFMYNVYRMQGDSPTAYDSLFNDITFSPIPILFGKYIMKS